MHWTNAPTPHSAQRTRSDADRVARIAAEPHENVEDGQDGRAEIGRADAPARDAPARDVFATGSVPRLRRADRI
jgi:hypothetical protein